jgi:hypothetical protein
MDGLKRKENESANIIGCLSRNKQNRKRVPEISPEERIFLRDFSILRIDQLR